MLFGLPWSLMEDMKRIEATTPLFLFNFNTRSVRGVFVAFGPACRNIDSEAWKSVSPHGYPAQIEIRRTNIDTSVSATALAFKPNSGVLEKSQVEVLYRKLGRPNLTGSGTIRTAAAAAAAVPVRTVSATRAVQSSMVASNQPPRESQLASEPEIRDWFPGYVFFVSDEILGECMLRKLIGQSEDAFPRMQRIGRNTQIFLKNLDKNS